jgi:hypothetical protein
MPTMNLLVFDGATGSPLGGANVKGTASTSCCSQNNWPNSCTSGGGGCDSGPGYPIDVNTNPGSGIAKWDEIHSCGQSFDLLVSAPGYSNTNVQITRGENSSDDYYTNPSQGVQLTPLQNVPQQNQGAAGTTSYTSSDAGIQGTSALGSGTASLMAGATSPGGIVMIVAVVAVIVIILVITAVIVIK